MISTHGITLTQSDKEIPNEEKISKSAAYRHLSICDSYMIIENEASIYEIFFKTLPHPSFIIDLNANKCETRSPLINDAAGNFLLSCSVNFYNNSHLEAFNGNLQDMINEAKRSLSSKFSISDILHIEKNKGDSKEEAIYNITANIFEGPNETRKLAIVLMEIPKAMKEQLRVLDCFKSSLMSALSHELNTPMNSLMPILKIMPSYKSDDREEDLKEVALSSAILLQSKIRDLIDYTKITLHEFDTALSEFYVNDLFEDLKKIFKYEVTQKLNTIVSKIETTSSFRLLVFADKNRIEQVLMKLVANANKFTQNGTIYLIASENKHNFNVTFSVKDTGSGISQEHLQNLFAPLPEKTKLTSRFAKLPGLGLDIAKSICENMGSQLIASSIKGKGTTFKFEIPTCRIIDFGKNKDAIYKNIYELPITTPKFKSCMNLNEKLQLMLNANPNLMKNKKRNTIIANNIPKPNTPNIDEKSPRRQLKKFYEKTTTCELPLLQDEIEPDYEVCDEESEIYQKLIHYQLALSPHGLYRYQSTVLDRSLIKANTSPIQKQQVVLVVDDMYSNRMVMHEMLKRFKIVTQEAINGQDAIQHVLHSFTKDSDYQISLILMDLNMPVMNGIEATLKIRNLEKSLKLSPIPIVAVTAQDATSDKRACIEAGMQDFALKPIDFNRLRKIIIDYIPRKIE